MLLGYIRGMYYEYDINTLRETVGEEIAREAAAAYDGNGVSLYDAVRITSADADAIGRKFSDAVDALKVRCSDIIKDSLLHLWLKMDPSDLPETIATEDALPKSGDAVMNPITAEVIPNIHVIYDYDPMDQPLSVGSGPSASVFYLDTQQESEGFIFYVPDFDERNAGTVRAEITRYLTLSVCASWFRDRYAVRSDEYAARSAAALDKAVAMLKTRRLHESKY